MQLDCQFPSQIVKKISDCEIEALSKSLAKILSGWEK